MTEVGLSGQTYYKQVHNIDIRHSRLIGVKNKKGTVVPIELCDVLLGQLFKGKLPEAGNISRKMLDLANWKPHQRLSEIHTGISPKVQTSANFRRDCCSMKLHFYRH